MSTARAVSSILSDCGATDHDGRVVSQLVDFATRYVANVVDDARRMSQMCQHENITDDDVKFALKLQLDRTAMHPPPTQFSLQMASEINAEPLPSISATSGLRLPPDRHCLLANHVQIPNRGDLLVLINATQNVQALPTQQQVQQQQQQDTYNMDGQPVAKRFKEEDNYENDDDDEYD